MNAEPNDHPIALNLSHAWKFVRLFRRSNDNCAIKVPRCLSPPWHVSGKGHLHSRCSGFVCTRGLPRLTQRRLAQWTVAIDDRVSITLTPAALDFDEVIANAVCAW